MQEGTSAGGDQRLMCRSTAKAIVKLAVTFDPCVLFAFNGLGFVLTFRRTDILPADYGVCIL